MPPVVEVNVFPQFIRADARKAVAMNETDPAKFWPVVSTRSLGDDTMLVKDVVDLQFEVLSQKLVSFMSSPASCQVELARWLATPAQRSGLGLPELTSKQLDAVHVLSDPMCFDLATIQKSLDVVDDPDMALANSLNLYPPGRHLVQAARVCLTRMTVQSSKADALATSIGTMETIAPLAARAWDCSSIAASLPQGLQSLSSAVCDLEDIFFKTKDHGLDEKLAKAKDPYGVNCLCNLSITCKLELGLGC